MQSSTTVSHQRFPSWLTVIFKEAVLHWKFNRYDLSSTLIPGVLFTLAAWHNIQPDWSALPATLFWALLYFWLYCTTFCISNQLAGIQEDRQNKPDRPLPAGLVSPQGALTRWAVAMGLFTLLGWYLKVLEWTLLWQVTLVLHNFGRLSHHYWTKNWVMTIGTIAQLAAAWQMVRPITPMAWTWILVPALTFLTHVSLQDLRDVDGDRLIGRRTFPIVFGDLPSRVFLAIAFALLPLLTHGALFAPAGQHPGAILFDILLSILSLVIAARVFWLRHPAADHTSYMIYTYWYCFLLAAAIVVL